MECTWGVHFILNIQGKFFLISENEYLYMYKDNLLENFTSFFLIIFSEIMFVHAPQIFNILFLIIKDIVLQDEK